MVRRFSYVYNFHRGVLNRNIHHVTQQFNWHQRTVGGGTLSPHCPRPLAVLCPKSGLMGKPFSCLHLKGFKSGP